MLTCCGVSPGSGLSSSSTIGEVRHAVPLAFALADGGLTCVEITFRTAAAAEAIKAVATEAPGVLVGAGTVRTGLSGLSGLRGGGFA